MFKLISMTNTIPKFLYITDVKIEAHLGPIETGGFGRIYIGKYKWRQVTLKVVNKIRNDVRASSAHSSIMLIHPVRNCTEKILQAKP